MLTLVQETDGTLTVVLIARPGAVVPAPVVSGIDATVEERLVVAGGVKPEPVLHVCRGRPRRLEMELPPDLLRRHGEVAVRVLHRFEGGVHGGNGLVRGVP